MNHKRVGRVYEESLGLIQCDMCEYEAHNTCTYQEDGKCKWKESVESAYADAMEG